MSGSLFLWLAVLGLLTTGLAATGTKVLRSFSRHELETYCRRRNRDDLYGEILDDHDEVALGSESLQVVGTILMVVSCGYWLLVLDQTSQPLLWHFVSTLLIGAFFLTAAISWIPLAVVRLFSAPFVFHTWWFWKIVDRILFPLTMGEAIADSIMRRLAGRPEEDDDEEEAFEDEIHAMLTEGQRDGLLEPDAREMIEGVIELGDTVVTDIMTPRSRIDAIDATMSWEDVLQFVIDVRRTRIPVYEKKLDQIVGVLYVKDLLPELAKPPGTDRRSIPSLVRLAWKIPETKAVDDLLQEFQATRKHLAIVVDEYDAVEGLVTIEDVLEEIVGEIVDEHDKDEIDDIRQIDDHTVEALGSTPIDDLNERLGITLPEPDDFDTISGLLINELGYIPKEGESVVCDDVRISVLKANRRRVEEVRIELLENGTRRETA